ncbi:hypothetical protein NC653_035362 [Populus alba x Populus x berolinensis]|uniref:Uncharacterized protein n=1 Tax=Populus alba x Populus x berolinensis TaxID=444605 RepID=A0AAD6PYZ5_9ROSI|nr:hypothetical protein NC653_035362 [Populus alba x Populus x berolinensis]
MESVASETVDDTLIVNGTSSSQEKAEISATYSWSHSRERDHAAATRIQKHYRGFRTRRNLADSIIAVELLWQTTLSRTPNTDVDVYIESEKHILSLLKWAETRVEKIDPRRRYSQNSYFFNLIWGDQCFLGSWKFDSNKIRDLKRSGESLFTTGKPTSVELRMDTTSSTQVGDAETFQIPSQNAALGGNIALYIPPELHGITKHGTSSSIHLTNGLERCHLVPLFEIDWLPSLSFFCVIGRHLRHRKRYSKENWISELTKTWTTWKGALPRWLEVIDPRHRVGRNLNFYFQKWMTSSGGQPFFYW